MCLLLSTVRPVRWSPASIWRPAYDPRHPQPAVPARRLQGLLLRAESEEISIYETTRCEVLIECRPDRRGDRFGSFVETLATIGVRPSETSRIEVGELFASTILLN